MLAKLDEMATRNLTDDYFLMRNNAIANKNIFHDNNYSDDRTALVIDMESGFAKTTSKLPPDWTGDVEEIQYEMTKIKNKLKELSMLHDKHLNRPSMDDNFDQEKQIDQITQDITQILGQNQMKIRKMSIRNTNSGSNSSYTDKCLIKNVVSNLATSLQDLTTFFRKNQNLYLKKIHSRKERSNMLFDTSQYSTSSALMIEENCDEDEDDANLLNLKQDQLQTNRANKQLINEREQEITHVVRSIEDLNEVFKNLATMIVDQGTVLDRIDYNIEKVAVHVDHGLVELQKAQKHQKTNKKMYCIGILILILVFMLSLLVLTKF